MNKKTLQKEGFVPLTGDFSNLYYQNLMDIYSLKKFLCNEDIADISGLPLLKSKISAKSILPKGN